MTPTPDTPLKKDDALLMLSVISKGALLLLRNLDPDTFSEGIRLNEQDLDKAAEQRIGVYPEIDPTFGYCLVLKFEEGDVPDVPVYVDPRIATA